MACEFPCHEDNVSSDHLIYKVGDASTDHTATIFLNPTIFLNTQVDRRLIAQDWNRKLQLIQAKAAEAAKELPPGFLDQFNGTSLLRTQ